VKLAPGGYEFRVWWIPPLPTYVGILQNWIKIVLKEKMSLSEYKSKEVILTCYLLEISEILLKSFSVYQLESISPTFNAQLLCR
jgi:hypothetical protein